MTNVFVRKWADSPATLRSTTDTTDRSPKTRVTDPSVSFVSSTYEGIQKELPPRNCDQLQGCPPAWLKLPVLPAERVETHGPDGSGSVYRVRLYGHHYRLLFRPGISAEQVRAERDDGKTWEAPSLAHLQRLAWLESIRAAALEDRPAEILENGNTIQNGVNP